MTKAKFKIGDTVKVKNFGQTYTTYEDMFELMGFKNTQYNGDIKNKEVGTIFGVQLHENQDTILYAIRTLDGREALIGGKGLVKVEDAPKVYSEAEVYKLTLETLDLGMRIRQDQLSGYSEKSGKELHKEWFDKVKKK